VGKYWGAKTTPELGQSAKIDYLAIIKVSEPDRGVSKAQIRRESHETRNQRW